jgi:hypothetical protein
VGHDPVLHPRRDPRDRGSSGPTAPRVLVYTVEAKDRVKTEEEQGRLDSVRDLREALGRSSKIVLASDATTAEVLVEVIGVRNAMRLGVASVERFSLQRSKPSYAREVWLPRSGHQRHRKGILGWRRQGRGRAAREMDHAERCDLEYTLKTP